MLLYAVCTMLSKSDGDNVYNYVAGNLILQIGLWYDM